MTIAVMGSGAFGTGLAISLCQNGPTTLWGRDTDAVVEMKKRRENHLRLPGFALPKTLLVTSDIHDVQGATQLLVAVPMQKLRGFLTTYAEILDGKQVIACCKGIELSTGLGPVSVIREILPNATPMILTGPSFAADIAKGLPTALTLACADTAAAKRSQNALSTSSLRIYRTADTIGAELGGAIKNVIAIACGAVMGAGLGESARAALMTRGYAEMQRLAEHLGAEVATLAGLSGLGDLALTCTSTQSRNYRLGETIGRGETFDPAVTVEGAATSLAVNAIANRNNLDLPITAAVADLLENRLDVVSAIATLLSRPLKEE